MTDDDKIINTMTRAFEKIAKDGDLRYFMRSLLALTGDNTTPYDTNALMMAYKNGRHSIGTDLRANMAEFAPKLYPSLLAEELVENRTNEKD